jgi:hypothetical protein
VRVSLISKLQEIYIPLDKYKERGSLFDPDVRHRSWIDTFRMFFWVNIALAVLTIALVFYAPAFIPLPIIIMNGIHNTKKTMEHVMCNAYPDFEPGTMLGLTLSIMFSGLLFLVALVWALW